MCDWNEWTRQQPPATSARLEPADSAYVFYRMEAGRIDRVRLFSPGCAIDAAGRPVEWLTGVSASRQRPHAERAGPDRRTPPGRRGDGRPGCCMPAPRPLTATIDLARTAATPHARGQALFWLSQRAGTQAAGAIDDALARDPDTEVKKRAVFALSQLPRRRGRAAPHPGGAQPFERRRPQAGDVLAGAVAGSAGAGLLRVGAAEVTRGADALSAVTAEGRPGSRVRPSAPRRESASRGPERPSNAIAGECRRKRGAPGAAARRDDGSHVGQGFSPAEVNASIRRRCARTPHADFGAASSFDD